MTGIFDPGLQPERTALAWRRTGLAMTVAGIAAVRVMPELLGPWAFVPAGLGLAASILITALAHRRHRIVHRTLTASRSDRVALPSGWLPLLTTAVTLAGGLLAIAVVIHDAVAAGR